MCLICGWIYDEAAGDPEHGIAPGTAWADVPMNWTCPECGARKEDFEMVTHWLKPQEAFVFTPEQLNEYTQSVIKQAFEAGRKLTVDSFEEEDFQDYEDCISNLKLNI